MECQYSNLLEDSLHVLCKILEIESYGMSYRSELVEFVLSTLDHYEYVIES